MTTSEIAAAFRSLRRADSPPPRSAMLHAIHYIRVMATFGWGVSPTRGLPPPMMVWLVTSEYEGRSISILVAGSGIVLCCRSGSTYCTFECSGTWDAVLKSHAFLAGRE